MGMLSRKTEIQKTRAVFGWAYAMELIDRPIRFGPSFKSPPRRAVLKARNSNGSRMFEADEIRQLLDDANPRMKAMILLGCNCGFGNSDVALLPLEAVDLEGGWIDFPRPKTGIGRRCPLWPETVEALRLVIDQRKRSRDKADADLVFLTQYGQRYIRLADKADGSADGMIWTDSVCSAFRALLKRLGMLRRGRSFYSLRHVFETIGGESIDQVAVNAIMGHSDQSMAGLYRERISDERLRAVVEHVRDWLFPPEDSR
jgi:integrase